MVVPANITLDRLHDVMQITIGWDDGHPHEFETTPFDCMLSSW
ncbi:IS1096 element passenger TnpR family protein [Pectobacterium brasiliense]|nr:hypothetical protein [Pectobacterium brasiliense]